MLIAIYREMAERGAEPSFAASPACSPQTPASSDDLSLPRPQGQGVVSDECQGMQVASEGGVERGWVPAALAGAPLLTAVTASPQERSQGVSTDDQVLPLRPEVEPETRMPVGGSVSGSLPPLKHLQGSRK